MLYSGQKGEIRMDNFYHPEKDELTRGHEPAQQPARADYRPQYGGADSAPYAAHPQAAYRPAPSAAQPDDTARRACSAPVGHNAAQPAARPVQTGEKEKSGSFVRGVLIGVAVCAVLALAIGLGVRLASGALGQGTASGDGGKETIDFQVSESPATNVEIIPDDGEKLTYAQIAAKFRCAVVSVTVYYDAYGWASYVSSEGSGFIIDESGYIVTNSHVIDDDNYADYRITVTIADANGEMNEIEAKVIGNDARTDLAVLKIDPDGLNLVVSDLGVSSNLVLGDEVVAIGNPGGSQFAGSVTNGIISGIDRIIEGDTGTADNAMKYLQTNAAINPGNSGGPLLNMYGKVIGINTAKIVDEGYEGLGFAIPIDTALPIIQQIIEEGSVVRPALGVSCSELSKQTAQLYDVPEGLLIRGFYSNSDMPRAGLEVGDIIVACDGVETLTLVDLQKAIENKNVGDTMELTVFRAGRSGTMTFTVTLIADNDLGELIQKPGRP